MIGLSMRLHRPAPAISARLSRAAKKRRAILIMFALTWPLVAASAPQRSKGISIHMLPQRVASLSGEKWGLKVDYSKLLQPEAEQPVLQTPGELLAFVRKQDKDIQENGVWIVTTHPDSYSAAEKKLLEDIKLLCHHENIALFTCRASELPNGWKRSD